MKPTKTDRFPAAGETDLELSWLGPDFRRRVVTRLHAAQRRRRIASGLVCFLALAGSSLLLPAVRWQLQPRPASQAAHWNPALDEDLAWLEESRSRWTIDDGTQWAETTDAKGNPLRYFFPDYQELEVEERQIALR